MSAAVDIRFGEQLHVEQTRGGMHLAVRIRSRLGDRTLARGAQQAGHNCQALSERYAKAPRPRSGVLMSFTNVTSPLEARQIAQRLHDAFAIG